MKIITTITRILVGLLFMFSGFIKSNDPKGTGIKLNEYFDVFASDFQDKQDSLLITFTDNQGHHDSSWQYLNVTDSVRSLDINRSALRNMVITSDDDTAASSDSVQATEVFVVMDGNILFQRNYIIRNQDDKHTVKLHVSTGADSVLLNKSYTVTSDNKLEVTEQLNVFPYIHPDHFLVGFFRALKPYSVLFSMILCILEIVLGFGILIGWKPKLIMWTTLITIVFFSFLTWYSAFYNKVTDCGCFGDFIKLEPWTSFYKDVVLTILIVFLFIRKNHIVPLFSKLFSWNAMTLVTVASISFTVYCNSYLPVWDFLPYKVGNNVRQLMVPPAGMRATDSIQMVYIMEKDGVKKDFMTMKDYMKANAEGWKYIDRKDSIIIKGWKSPIHDFAFSKREDNDIDIKDSLMNGHAFQLLIVSGDITKANEDAWEDIKQLVNDAKAKGIQIHAVTSSGLQDADLFVSEQQLPFKFNNADQTLLKTIVRSNPGVMFWKDATILGKWSSRNIPKIQKLEKLMK